MKKHYRLYGILIALSLLFFTACSEKATTKESKLAEETQNAAYESLMITGDVLQVRDINSYWNELKLEDVSVGEEKVKGTELLSAIEANQVIYKAYDVALIAKDGFMVKLDGATIEGTYLVYLEDKEWCYISDQHPVNSRIKEISEIIVVKKSTEKANYAYGLDLVLEDETVHRSIGELLSGTYESIAFFDGVSELNGISIDVMKRKKCVRLDSLTDLTIETMLVMDSEGNHHYVHESDAYIEIASQGLNFISLDMKTVIRDIEGIVMNPIAGSIMDNYYDASYYLDQGQKVLTLFIDGYSYQQYKVLKDQYPELFLGGIENVNKAMSVYKPVTNAGFAAMVSGETPGVNGVLDRSYREVKVPTIFDYATDLGYTSILIEGNVNILKLETEIYLNSDEDEDGYIDDEIYESAMDHIYEGYQYALVHFHSVDDSGHKSGKLSDQTLDRLKVIDTYVSSLIEGWDGKVIIVADHGMHDTEEGGDHGEFRHEDLFVPYVITNGGKTNE